MAVLVQAVTAAVAAIWVRRLRSIHGLFAAFVAGCVMVVGILGLNLAFGGSIDPTIAWTTISLVVNGGALLSLPVAAVVSILKERLGRDPRSPSPEGPDRPRFAPGYGAEDSDRKSTMPEKDRPRYCAQCGGPVKAGTKFCEVCGARVAGGGSREAPA